MIKTSLSDSNSRWPNYDAPKCICRSDVGRNGQIFGEITPCDELHCEVCRKVECPAILTKRFTDTSNEALFEDRLHIVHDKQMVFEENNSATTTDISSARNNARFDMTGKVHANTYRTSDHLKNRKGQAEDNVKCFPHSRTAHEPKEDNTPGLKPFQKEYESAERQLNPNVSDGSFEGQKSLTTNKVNTSAWKRLFLKMKDRRRANLRTVDQTNPMIN